MSPVLVDSNVLLDIITDDPTWGVWSADTLTRTADEEILVINALIYAEVSISFAKIEDLEQALPSTIYRRESLPYEAAFLAGKAFVQYRRRGGGKTAPLPDFFIGAHAAVAGFRVLTRDSRRYRTYFPTVELQSP